MHAAGFRNPFGLLYTPDGRIYGTDNGPNDKFGKLGGCREHRELFAR